MTWFHFVESTQLCLAPSLLSLVCTCLRDGLRGSVSASFFLYRCAVSPQTMQNANTQPAAPETSMSNSRSQQKRARGRPTTTTVRTHGQQQSKAGPKIQSHWKGHKGWEDCLSIFSLYIVYVDYLLFFLLLLVPLLLLSCSSSSSSSCSLSSRRF